LVIPAGLDTISRFDFERHTWLVRMRTLAGVLTRGHVLARNPINSGVQPELSESGPVYREVGGVGGTDRVREETERDGR
jgi:hypothetical protein